MQVFRFQTVPLPMFAQSDARKALPERTHSTTDFAVTIRAQRDKRFMRAALKEAEKAHGQTSPNPAVGAVLVIDNRIVARGHHRGAGHDHAEIECLQNFAAEVPARATLYVTLEPCSTVGRTAPCTTAIIKAGVKNIVVGTTDVNPRHFGRGMSLDGRLMRHPGEPRWITGFGARRDAHQLRSQVDAILVGAQTLRLDNP